MKKQFDLFLFFFGKGNTCFGLFKFKPCGFFEK